MIDRLREQAGRFRTQVPAATDWSVRLVMQTGEGLQVRRGVAEPAGCYRSLGACVSVNINGSCAYAAGSDTSPEGLHRTFERARDLASKLAPWQLFEQPVPLAPAFSTHYEAPVVTSWHEWSLTDKYDYLMAVDARLAIDQRIVEHSAALQYDQVDTLLYGPDHEISQHIEFLSPSLLAVASDGADTQSRTYGADRPAQAGLEHLQTIEFRDAAERTAREALSLLEAPDCPAGQYDLLLMPGQMMLQIHESIGHPLELDRILGDERNYAGGSFIRPGHFGNYRYGSSLLNVTFDPDVAGELASYACDDSGAAASRQYLIREGLLLRPLGGKLSQARAGLPGVACARACDWNRPPIDRMANINIEPGDQSMSDLIQSIEHGVLMNTNRSWSIDDNRNKFQFGCEYGRLIENGRLGGVVKNPNYRGISADFWHSLRAVGNSDTCDLHGVHTCGKGEPNQALYAGHAAPACVFAGVAVFGGD